MATDTDPPNPNSDNRTREVKGAISSTISCSHCKKNGHEKERCWFLHPHLQPKKWKVQSDGRKGEAEREKAKNPKGERRKGYGSKTLELKEAERERVENLKGEKRVLGAAHEKEEKGKSSGSGRVEKGASNSQSFTREDLGPILAHLASLLKPKSSGLFNNEINFFKPKGHLHSIYRLCKPSTKVHDIDVNLDSTFKP